MQREGLGTGLGVQRIWISSTELSEDDSGRQVGLGMRGRGLGVVTCTRELTEDESESFEVEGSSSAFSGTFKVEGASSDFSGSLN